VRRGEISAARILRLVAMARKTHSVEGGSGEAVPQVGGRAVECARRGTGGMGPHVGEVSARMKGVLARRVHTSMRRVWRTQGGGPSRGFWAEAGRNVGPDAEQLSSSFCFYLF
jgi:hypothetical protein